MIRFFSETLLILYMTAGCLLQARATGGHAEEQITIESRTTTWVDQASSLLRQAAVWGGIEDYRSDCGTDPDLRLPAFSGTLREALTRLVSQDPNLSWQSTDDGILVRKNPPTRSLLDVRIAHFTFDKNGPPDRATNPLLNLPSVRRRMNALDMSVRSPELGFAQEKRNSESILTLKNITLRQGLNAIAHSSPPRVWLFRQSTCGGHRTIQIQWIIK